MKNIKALWTKARAKGLITFTNVFGLAVIVSICMFCLFVSIRDSSPPIIQPQLNTIWMAEVEGRLPTSERNYTALFSTVNQTVTLINALSLASAEPNPGTTGVDVADINTMKQKTATLEGDVANVSSTQGNYATANDAEIDKIFLTLEELKVALKFHTDNTTIHSDNTTP